MPREYPMPDPTAGDPLDVMLCLDRHTGKTYLSLRCGATVVWYPTAKAWRCMQPNHVGVAPCEHTRAAERFDRDFPLLPDLLDDANDD